MIRTGDFSVERIPPSVLIHHIIQRPSRHIAKTHARGRVSNRNERGSVELVWYAKQLFHLGFKLRVHRGDDRSETQRPRRQHQILDGRIDRRATSVQPTRNMGASRGDAGENYHWNVLHLFAQNAS